MSSSISKCASPILQEMLMVLGCACNVDSEVLMIEFIAIQICRLNLQMLIVLGCMCTHRQLIVHYECMRLYYVKKNIINRQIHPPCPNACCCYLYDDIIHLLHLFTSILLSSSLFDHLIVCLLTIPNLSTMYFFSFLVCCPPT